ncbi:excalibur calcium-binding domain-containing protein [Noviherbaspirillum aridicola]|uniref:excalibur calcium-binding domain-containing protein n=1 Tax=Noviherbaspirillum aridicola TaxID=2849687 RepID=UPI001C7ECE75|nr:excalibur calcium-binding domain-containing protein [Noviherbaspirillum aridicola]
MTRTGIALLFALAPGTAFAHGGGVNSEGCHTNRRTGDYHCHGGRPTTPSLPLLAPSSGPASGNRSSASSSWRTSPFANCSEARAAGAAPVRRGDPGYGPHLDRDNDGVGCEPYRR